MIPFEVTAWSKGRMWIGELPDAHYNPNEVVTRTFEVMPNPEIGQRCAAIEYARARCGSSTYAMLGAEFMPAKTGALVVTACVSIEETSVFADAQPIMREEVRIGLPKEYVSVVFETVRDLPERHYLGAGTLTFGCAAHSVVGSSWYLFALLTRAVTRLLLLNKEPHSQDELQLLLFKDT